jgi:hypothetical protein
MSDNAEISAAQNPDENASEAAYSDSNWKSDFDALNGIQYILYLMSVNPNLSRWSDAIQSDLDCMYDYCQAIGLMHPLCDPFAALDSSDAVKLIAPLAEQLLVLYPDPPRGSLPDLIQIRLRSIIVDCKDIDPSSAS